MRKYLKGLRIHEKLTLKIVMVLMLTSVVTLMTILLVSVVEVNQNFSDQLDQDLNKIVLLQSRVEEMDRLYSSISNYAVSGSEDYLRDYMAISSNLNEFINEVSPHPKGTEGYFLYVDLASMFESFVEQADAAKKIYESGRDSLYVDVEINELSKNNAFVKEQLTGIISYELNQIEDKYGNIETSIAKRQEVVYLIVFVVIILTLFIGVLVANRLTHPIDQLSSELKQIGKGNYDPRPLEVNGIGEISGMISGFNKMKSRLSENIELIHENARIKEQLKNQEIDLLESENHLKQSKLDFLQSQINPHFLYNTLNSIQTLADIEEAPQTELMLEHLSNLMRYNVKKTNTVVMLSEELEVINSYVYIQLIRFGNRMTYNVDCDPEVLNVMVPSMILQPLIENAMIHGLEPKMGRGELLVSAKMDGDQVIITVRDNGLGMEQKTINRLLAYGESSTSEDVTKNAKSIGVANVIRRCRLYYGHNVLSISSVLDEYTEFVFSIEKHKTS